MTQYDDDDLVELYAPANAVEADRLVLLLAEDGVEALARATTSSSFPTAGQMLLLVRGSELAKATSTIENARREGAISQGGDWLHRP
jgi:hypothetical protein